MTTDDLISMYDKGAITGNHLIVESLCMVDPADPAPVLDVFTTDILRQMLEYAQGFQEGRMRSNFGHQPELRQVEAAKIYIEAALCSGNAASVEH